MKNKTTSQTKDLFNEKKKLKFVKWIESPRADGRMEWVCKHPDGSYGPGHGNHPHCCDGCCARDDYPGRVSKKF